MNKISIDWSLLDRLKDNSALPYIDYSLAKFLLKNEEHPDQSVAAFICHLSLSSRQGHLCIHVDDNKILPDPKSVWLRDNLVETEEENPVISDDDLCSLNALILEGSKSLSKSLCETDTYNFTSKPVFQTGCRFYFHKNRKYETDVIKYFTAIRSHTGGPELDFNRAEKMISDMVSAKSLLPEQAEAIRSAIRKNFTIICGGPGTGKTYTAGHLIKIYWSCISDDKKSKCEIVLAAPTGKAAANLQKSLSIATTEIPQLANLQAKTLHSLLQVHSKSNKSESGLSADFILIDESSMIDAKMMGLLLKAVKPGAKLILLGDPHQLPPVESGALFGDMIACLSGPEISDVSLLKTCLRSDLKAIIDFSRSINDGDCETARKMMNQHPGVIFNRHQSFYAAMEDALQFFPSTWDGAASPTILLNEYLKFRILSPLKKGLMGVEYVNRLFYSKLKKSADDYEWFAAPIMVVRNDYGIGLFNGEVGVLFCRNNKSYSGYFQKGDFAVFPDRSGKEDHVNKIPALLLPKFEYAYCLSVHKSQGSEFDRVLLLLPEGSEVFGREVLYTGVTRSRKCIEIHGNEHVFRQTIINKTVRLSGLPEDSL